MSSTPPASPASAGPASPSTTPPPIRRIGVLTGGGDCPGLNAVIRAVTTDAIFNGIHVTGFLDGFLGLIQDRSRPLNLDDVRSIITEGGTILGTSNKANPRRFITGKDAAGNPIIVDKTAACVETCRRHRLDALVVIGGDGTMSSAATLLPLGVNVVGVPKTIDNDIEGTELTFGFLTAVSIAAEALDRVRTTAASHERAMVVEVMGRNAGWIALHAGLASGVDVILIPEIGFDLPSIAADLRRRVAAGQSSFVICVAEGAAPAGGKQIVARTDVASFDPIRLGGVGKFVADEIERLTSIESRHVVLGHTQRGGTPAAADRVLATELGWQAMSLLKEGRFGRMVAIQRGRMADVPIDSVANKQRRIPADHPLLAVARSVYVTFGEPQQG